MMYLICLLNALVEFDEIIDRADSLAANLGEKLGEFWPGGLNSRDKGPVRGSKRHRI